ncbi:MAG: hypothetical protein H0X39_07985, partial [Actinobacteria bacterium]|nr:hypothetical protein [Actinomycetota bacterium]
LQRLRTTPRRGMRETYRCSACGGTKILHFAHIKDMAHDGMVDLALQKEVSMWSGLKHSAGALEAYVCRSCRLVEWHAISLVGVTTDGTEVIELDGTPDDDVRDPVPYR